MNFSTKDKVIRFHFRGRIALREAEERWGRLRVVPLSGSEDEVHPGGGEVRGQPGSSN